MSSIRTTTRFFRAGVHRIAGSLWFHLGSAERAQRHMQRVLELRGDDFTAYVYLGRLAYSRGDYVGWRRECEHARRTSPERFARLRHPFELHRPPQAAGTVFEEAGERASWRTYRVSKIGGAQPATSSLHPVSPDQAQPDDFESEAERARFRGLRPLRRDEIRATNLDDLARRLCE